MSARQRKIREKAARRREKFLATVLPDIGNLSFRVASYDCDTKLAVAARRADTGRAIAISFQTPRRWKRPERFLPEAIDKLIRWGERTCL